MGELFQTLAQLALSTLMKVMMKPLGTFKEGTSNQEVLEGVEVLESKIGEPGTKGENSTEGGRQSPNLHIETYKMHLQKYKMNLFALIMLMVLFMNILQS